MQKIIDKVYTTEKNCAFNLKLCHMFSGKFLILAHALKIKFQDN